MMTSQLALIECREDYFQQLFKQCNKVSAFLQGDRCAEKSGMLLPNVSNKEGIAQLYQELRQQYPAAGSAYWLARCWTLLSWQPIYVAFVAIYQLRSLPDLGSMVQHRSPALVAGFSLPSDHYLQADYPQLIVHAGQQLSRLFVGYFADLSQQGKVRSSWQKRFLVDAVLLQLLALQRQQSDRNNEFIFQHARMWLTALGLPRQYLSAINVNASSNELSLVRKSCCLAFKVEPTSLCDECPCHRRNKNHK